MTVFAVVLSKAREGEASSFPIINTCVPYIVWTHANTSSYSVTLSKIQETPKKILKPVGCFYFQSPLINFIFIKQHKCQ